MLVRHIASKISAGMLYRTTAQVKLCAISMLDHVICRLSNHGADYSRPDAAVSDNANINITDQSMQSC